MVSEAMTEGYPLLLLGLLNLLFMVYAPCWIVNCTSKVMANMLGSKVLQNLKDNVDHSNTVFTAEYAAALQTKGCATRTFTEDGWFSCPNYPVGNVSLALHNKTGEVIDYFAGTLIGAPLHPVLAVNIELSYVQDRHISAVDQVGHRLPNRSDKGHHSLPPSFHFYHCAITFFQQS